MGNQRFRHAFQKAQVNWGLILSIAILFVVGAVVAYFYWQQFSKESIIEPSGKKIEESIELPPNFLEEMLIKK